MAITDRLDLSRVRIAAEDNAHAWFGGPLNFGRSDACRYVSEGCLGQFPLREAWAAVAEYIDAHPDVLTYTRGHVDQVRRQRDELSESMSSAAAAAYQAGDLAEAGRLIDTGEVLNPDYRTVGGRRSWSELRAFRGSQGGGVGDG